jgi:hypothetical protein
LSTYFFLSHNLHTGTLSLILKILIFAKICVKILFCKYYLSPLNTFIRKGKDPEPEPDHMRIRTPNTRFKCLTVKVSWHATKLTALPENSANFLASNSAIFVQRTISPMTAFTLGWLMTVVNQRVTLTYGFLQIQPRVTGTVCCRAADPNSCDTDTDPAFRLNTDPDPIRTRRLMKKKKISKTPV